MNHVVQTLRSAVLTSILVLLLTTGCARPLGDQPTSMPAGVTTPTAGPTSMPSFSSVAERARPAVVRIETDLKVGTGFIFEIRAENRAVGGSALVLTDQSVVEGAASINVIVRGIEV